MEKLCNFPEILWRKYGKYIHQNEYNGDCKLPAVENDTFYGGFVVKLIWRMAGDSMESGNLFGDFMANLVWGLCGDWRVILFNLEISWPT